MIRAQTWWSQKHRIGEHLADRLELDLSLSIRLVLCVFFRPWPICQLSAVVTFEAVERKAVLRTPKAGDQRELVKEW